MAERIPNSSFAARRDARFKAERIRKARLARLDAMPADYSRAKVTICPPAVARGAYNAARNLQAAARLKAKAKRQ